MPGSRLNTRSYPCPTTTQFPQAREQAAVRAWTGLRSASLVDRVLPADPRQLSRPPVQPPGQAGAPGPRSGLAVAGLVLGYLFHCDLGAGDYYRGRPPAATLAASNDAPAPPRQARRRRTSEPGSGQPGPSSPAPGDPITGPGLPSRSRPTSGDARPGLPPGPRRPHAPAVRPGRSPRRTLPPAGTTASSPIRAALPGATDPRA